MDPIKLTKKYFDKPFRTDARNRDRPIDRFIFESICRSIPCVPKQNFAVDLGCHWGRYTRILAESFEQVVGVDFAGEAIATAPARFNVSYQKLDLERDELIFDRRVDLFVAIGLFEMLRKPGVVMEKMARCAAGGGRVFIVIPNRFHIHFFFLRFSLWIGRVVMGRRDLFIYHNGVTPEVLIRNMARVGFELIAGGGIVGAPPSVLSRCPLFLQRFMLQWDRFVFALLGGAYDWMHFQKK